MGDGKRHTHYDTLRVSRTASREEIRAAFRRLAKVYHPDKNPRRTAWAEARMHELLRAYETLADDRRRFLYDRELRTRHAGVSFVEKMQQNPDDPGAQSKLILHYLLQQDFDRAIDLHERLLLRRATFNLGQYLDERDHLDALFLMGEAYETRRQWRTAMRFYWEAYQREKTEPRKRYFFDELKDRLRVLFSKHLVRGLSPEDTLKNYRRALALGIDKREAALIYKKIAALHCRMGRRDKAIEALDKARRLCPGMKTLDELKKKIAGA